MIKREAFRQLCQDFIAHISRYENTDPEMLEWVTEKIDAEVPKLEQSLRANKLPPATFGYAWHPDTYVPQWPHLIMSDVGGRRLFLEITSQPRFDNILDQEMPE